MIQSETFPGLWLDVLAFDSGDDLGMIATLDQGLAIPEHANFVASLARR